MNPIDQVRRAGLGVDPGLLRALRRSGALNPPSILGAFGSFPWVVGRGPSLGVLSKIHGRARGAKPALFDRQGWLTWADLDGRTNRLAHALRDQGVAPGETVATLLRNGREAVETLLATQKLGLAVAPLNTWATPRELTETLRRSEPKLLIYDTQHAEQVRQADTGESRLVAAGPDPLAVLPDALRYEAILEEQPSGPPRAFTRTRVPPRILVHTSGTTGTPKAAARETPARGIGVLLGFLATVPYRADDVILCPAPLFHAFGLLTLTVSALVGSTLVLPDRFDAAESLAAVERHGVTAASFVPVMIRRILALPPRTRRRHDLSTLRIVLASGSALTADTRRAARRLFGDVLYDLYGSTEAGWVAVATPEDMAKDIRTLGRPVPGVDVAILEPDGTRLPPNETGLICVRSEAAFEGYTTGEEVRRIGEHMSLGDSGWLDEDGRLYVAGRADEMVVVGGENVYPIEVEQIISRVPGVRDVAVVGMPDRELGQVLAAFIEGTATEQRVLEACRKDLASFKVPRAIEFVDELPRTASGKVRKPALVERLASRRRSSA